MTSEVIDPVSPFRRGPSGEIQLQQGGMCLLLAVGIPFFLAGIYLALGALGLVPVKDEFGRQAAFLASALHLPLAE